MQPNHSAPSTSGGAGSDRVRRSDAPGAAPQTVNRTVSAPQSAFTGARSNLPTPELSTLADVQRRSGYKSVQPVTRPSYWGVDLDLARRPGVPMLHDPTPLPNAVFPIERQPGEPAAPMHGRPNKRFPPVFGTAIPLKGVSGVIRRAAYRLPDHKPTHWLLKLLGDRVDALEHRALRLGPAALPFVAFTLAGMRMFRSKHAPRGAARFDPRTPATSRG